MIIFAVLLNLTFKKWVESIDTTLAAVDQQQTKRTWRGLICQLTYVNVMNIAWESINLFLCRRITDTTVEIINCQLRGNYT